MKQKALLAANKPFSDQATAKIRGVVEQAGCNLVELKNYGEQSHLLEAIADVDAVIIRSDIIDSPVINAARQLKLVVRAGAGYDNVDLAACSERRIVVMNTPGQNSNAVAELVIGLMIYAARNFFQPGTGSELKGKKLGLQAFGNVGRLVAEHARGMGIDICAYDPFVADEKLNEMKVTPVKSLSQLYSTCDIVSLHIPALPDTIRSIGYDLVKLMPKNGVLINTARKEIIDEESLEKVLTKRPDLKYVTDVMPDNYLKLSADFPNQVYSTPKKMGAETAEANLNAGIAAAQQVVGFLRDGSAPFKVN